MYVTAVASAALPQQEHQGSYEAMGFLCCLHGFPLGTPASSQGRKHAFGDRQICNTKLTKGSCNRFQHLIHPWPNRVFSLYLSHASAFASLWHLRQFTHNAGHSSDTVLPRGTCIMGSSPSLRLSYFRGEMQRKVLTVCFRHQSCLLLFKGRQR